MKSSFPLGRDIEKCIFLDASQEVEKSRRRRRKTLGQKEEQCSFIFQLLTLSLSFSRSIFLSLSIFLALSFLLFFTLSLICFILLAPFFSNVQVPFSILRKRIFTMLFLSHSFSLYPSLSFPLCSLSFAISLPLENLMHITHG